MNNKILLNKYYYIFLIDRLIYFSKLSMKDIILYEILLYFFIFLLNYRELLCIINVFIKIYKYIDILMVMVMVITIFIKIYLKRL